MNWLNEVLNNDTNPLETQEWIESLKAVIDVEGPERAHQLLEGMVELTRRSGAFLPFSPTTEYVNTIEPQLEAKSPAGLLASSCGSMVLTYSVVGENGRNAPERRVSSTMPSSN